MSELAKKEVEVRYMVDNAELKLTPRIVLKYLTNGQNVPEAEVMKFMMLCKARQLNPFTGDVHLVAYGGKANVIVGKETYTKRAQRNPRFRGHEAGVTVLSADGTRLSRRDGSLVIDGETLVGGWAKVYVEGLEAPIFDEVSLKEYSTGQSMWKSKPSTMIRKVALVHALREAFPDEMGGLYDSSEMGEAGEQPTPPPIEVPAEAVEVVEPEDFEPEAELLEEDEQF